MNEFKEVAYEILDISKNIYEINVKTNPTAIFKNKIFLIGTENNPDAVSIETDYEKKDSSYYFETPDIVGVIIKRNNGTYCIKASVKYRTAKNQELWFAKIRIESSLDGDIQIRGKWGGSWEAEDFYDEDFLNTPNSDLPAALVSMQTHLTTIHNQLCENNGLNSDANDQEWVKKLKKYNN